MAGPSGRTPVGNYPFPIPNDTVDTPRDIEALARAIDPNAVAVIIGEVRTFGLAAAPARWLLCDGAAVEQATYPELFAALSGRWNTGGESPTQFRVPDLRGRAMVGAGAGAGLTNRALAARWGVESVALQLTEIPNHSHGGATGADSPDHSHYTSGTTGTDSPDHAHSQFGARYQWTYAGGGTTSSSVAGWWGYEAATAGANARHAHSFAAWSGGASARHTHGIAAEGGGGAHNNAQPSLALLVCIYAGR